MRGQRNIATLSFEFTLDAHALALILSHDGRTVGEQYEMRALGASDGESMLREMSIDCVEA